MKKKTLRKAPILISIGISSLFGISLKRMLTAGFRFTGPLKDLGIRKIERTYDPDERCGEIVFYGASNFTLWKSMERDIPQYHVQNHGFGGSNDQDLMDYAARILYPYAPKIVVFQTGSNDYVAAEGTEAEKISFCMQRKKRMFDLFHEHLPDSHFIVLSGILLPGRNQYVKMTQEINRQLSEFCESKDYMTFVDAEALTYHNGKLDSSLFIEDGIHLTDTARVIWANEYIIPALDRVVAGMGTIADSLKR